MLLPGRAMTMCDLTQRIANHQNGSFSQAAIKRMHLLAASAGTGKTYSIQTLYLRLVLVEGLTVQQILVVTFTKDATKELRDRLQRVLREALDYLNGTAKIADPNDRTRMMVDVARANPGDSQVRQRLQLALLDFDMAAIYTIHGFCQRVLNRFAFETRQAFDVEPAGDTSDEIKQLCKDWWRRNVYPMGEKVAGFLSNSGRFSLAAITELARKLISKPDAKLLPPVERMNAIEQKMARMLRDFAESHPVKAAETNPYPNALPEVREAVKAIQEYLKTLRDSIASQAWDAALNALDAATTYAKTIPIDCQAALFKECKAFRDMLPTHGVNATQFVFDNKGWLTNKQYAGLTAAHTQAIKAAVCALNLTSLEEQYKPCAVAQLYALGPRKGQPRDEYHATKLLTRHFCLNEPCAAKDLYDAINTISKEKGAGIADVAEVNIAAINPAFSQLKDSLFAECSHAVSRAALAVKEQYRASRPAATTASFDDYLVNLRDALDTEPAGQKDGLVTVLRNEFKAALIDEFQDTDPIQWGIFERLFKDAPLPCFLVGDPKQAIYRFRNGDIETYLQATKGKATYPLDKNYRSEKRLIDAVNQVFMDGCGHKTFGEDIDYEEPLDAKGKDKDKSLLVDKNTDEKPFKILLIENSSAKGRLPGKNSPSAKYAYEITALEIARILKDDKLTIGGRRVSRKDIAVLVSKHDEGEYIARELARLNIPAVRQGTGDVWQTDEGFNLWVVLEAVLDFGNLSNVRRALLSNWFGLTPEQIQALNNNQSINRSVGRRTGGSRLEDWVAEFEGLLETWIKRGFPAMFRRLSGTLGLKRRLLGLEDKQGQRRLANINHLCELVEQAIVDGRKTPEGTLSWLRRQFDKATSDGGDEVTLRLETDDDAVRIMTIFTSKGLEFPIVFAPTLFMMKPRQDRGLYEFHEGAALRIARAIKDDPASKTAKDSERNEMEQEEVRQIYVAFTRAVHRTVVLALNDGVNDGKAKKNEAQKYKMPGILGQVLRLPMKKEGDNIAVDMDAVEDRFSNIPNVECAVEVAVADLQQKAAFEPDKPTVDREPAKDKPKPDTSKGHGSFTSLAPRDSRKADGAGTEAEAEAGSKNRDGETASLSMAQVEVKPEGIFAFPSGARTGTCWHEIFEDLAFNATGDVIKKMVEDKLRIHGFLKNEDKRQERIDVTSEMVDLVLHTSLPSLNEGAPFTLATVADKDRKTEWEFSFTALPEKRTRELRDVVFAYEPYNKFLNEQSDWDKAIPGGYLTGFVDLLFRKDGRFYIADWKSNRRNGTQGDFSQDGLKDEVARHIYWLQYLIYTVAVHQFLSKSLTSYKYEKHFGGIYYVFLRGVDGKQDAQGHANGIYMDRPELDLVEKLSGILGDFS